METVYRAVLADAGLRRLHVNVLPQRPKRRVNAVDLGGMTEVREAIHFLSGPAEGDIAVGLSKHLAARQSTYVTSTSLSRSIACRECG
jgi:hypothetical protein